MMTIMNPLTKFLCSSFQVNAKISTQRPAYLLSKYVNPCNTQIRCTSTGTDEKQSEDDRKLKIIFKPKPCNAEYLSKINKGVVSASTILSATRLLSAPVISYMLCNDLQNEALGCFLFAVSTDIVDKYLPKRTYSDEFYDNLADKLFTAILYITIFNIDLIYIYPIKGFMCRDMIVAAAFCFLRYVSFDQKPNLRKYLNFNRYPTQGLGPQLVGKVYLACSYGFIGTLIATSHLKGMDEQYWIMMGGSFLVGFFTALSLSWLYVFRIASSVKIRSYRISRLKNI